ncbi:MAG: TIGR03067 domain-containing protein [Gemmataceae bacterium]
MIATLMLSLVMSSAPMDNESELKAVAGVWKPEKVTIDGGDQTGAFAAAKLTLDKENYTVEFGAMKDIGIIKIDATKMPKTMDITGTKGPNEKKTYLCIYELKDDTFTVCYGLDEKVRPTKFESAKDSNTMLIVYKREKK